MKAHCMQIGKSTSEGKQNEPRRQWAFGIAPGNGQLHTQGIPHTVCSLGLGGLWQGNAVDHHASYPGSQVRGAPQWSHRK